MRVNVITPRYLTDNHLIAEYREMKMSTYYYVRSSKSKNGIDSSRISERYTLNGGYAYMWIDKFGYIDKRFKAILVEMKRRGFQTNFPELNYTDIPKEAFGDFEPNQDDIRINLDRVLERIDKQSEWYKFEGENVTDWVTFYEDLFQEGKLLGLD